MNKICLLLPLACCGGLLQACATPQPADPLAAAGLRLEPHLAVRNSDNSARGFFELGNYYQNRHRLDQAANAYLAALQRDPGHVDARNALGMVYAAQGRLDVAIAQFKRILEQQPQLAHVQNNLGYAYYLQGKYAEAVRTLGEAVNLAPDNAHAYSNLGLAYEKMSQPEQAQQALARARQLSAPAVPAATAVAEAVPEPEIPQPLAACGSGMAQECAPPAAPAGPPLRTAAIRLEIANGNGIAGMARQFSLRLRQAGFPAARLSNHKPYGQRETVVQYRDGHYQDALALRRQLALPAALVKSGALRGGTDVRLLLGRDAAQVQFPA